MLKICSSSIIAKEADTYGFAFLEPPHGNAYLKSDFIQFNDLLFPNKPEVELYRWNDDFSNYFDEGKEYDFAKRKADYLNTYMSNFMTANKENIDIEFLTDTRYKV